MFPIGGKEREFDLPQFFGERAAVMGAEKNPCNAEKIVEQTRADAKQGAI